MRRLINLSLLILTLLFISTSVVSANVGTRVRAEIKENNLEKRVENRQRVNSVRRERIRSYFGRMVTRLEATIERLTKISEKISTRIDSLEGDQSALKDQVKLANQKISSAQTELNQMKTDIETVLDSDKPQDEFKGIIDSVKKIKMSLVEAHRLLVQVIGDIKGLGEKQNEE